MSEKGSLSMRRFAVVLTCTVLTMLLAPAALGAPNNSPNAKRVPVECEGASVTVVLVPGLGKPLWDVSTEDASNGPDFLIRAITQEVFVNDEFIGVFSFTFGTRTGQGESIVCTYAEHFIDPSGDRVNVLAAAYLVPR